MHNRTFVHHLTPSPYVDNNVPYPSPESTPPQRNATTPPDSDKAGLGRSTSRPGKAAEQKRVFTVVLHPTVSSRQEDLKIEVQTFTTDTRGMSKKAQAAAAKEGATPMSAYPPTPLSSIAPTPVTSKAQLNKRQRLRLDEHDIYPFQAEFLRNVEFALYLEPAESFEDSQAILKALTHPQYNNDPPKQKGRKRTHAELEADEAAAAEEERIALICDSRLGPSVGSASSGAAANGEGHEAVDAMSGDFQRIKRFEDARVTLAERARQQAELRNQPNEQTMRQHAAHQKFEQQKQNRDRQAQLQELKRTGQAQTAETIAQNAPLHMRHPSAQQVALNNIKMQHSNQNQHSSPLMGPTSGMGSSPVTAAPMMRPGMPPSVGMQNQGFNSPRPGSAMSQHAQMGQPMVRNPSQQPSHPSQSQGGTPHMAQVMTPQMGNMPGQQGSPMHHGSPAMNPNMNGVPTNPQTGMPISSTQMEMMKRRQFIARLMSMDPQARQHALDQMEPQQRNNTLALLTAQAQHQRQQQQQHQQQQQGSPHGHGMPNGNGMPNNAHAMEEARRRAAYLAQTQQQRSQQMPPPTPTTNGGPFPPSMQQGQNMIRHSSQQPQQMGQGPNMYGPRPQQSPPQGHPMHQQGSPTSGPGPAAGQQQMSPAQVQAHHMARQKAVFVEQCRNRNGGTVPENVDQLWISMLQQKQQQTRRAQGMQGQQGQNPNMMRPGMGSGGPMQNGNQGPNQGFHPQMSPPHMQRQNGMNGMNMNGGMHPQQQQLMGARPNMNGNMMPSGPVGPEYHAQLARQRAQLQAQQMSMQGGMRNEAFPMASMNGGNGVMSPQQQQQHMMRMQSQGGGGMPNMMQQPGQGRGQQQ